MGQRLNIEIRKKNKTLASSYYHWSGYTYSALHLTCIVVVAMDANRQDEFTNDKKYAAQLLYETGARFNGDQEKYAKKYDFTEEEIEKFSEGVNRNSGLLGIRPIENKATRQFEEARVMIDIEKKTINFDVFWGTDGVPNVNYPLKECPVNPSRIKMEEFIKFVAFLDDLAKNDEDYFTYRGRTYGVIG